MRSRGVRLLGVVLVAVLLGDPAAAALCHVLCAHGGHNTSSAQQRQHVHPGAMPAPAATAALHRHRSHTTAVTPPAPSDTRSMASMDQTCRIPFDQATAVLKVGARSPREPGLLRAAVVPAVGGGALTMPDRLFSIDAWQHPPGRSRPSNAPLVLRI